MPKGKLDWYAISNNKYLYIRIKWIQDANCQQITHLENSATYLRTAVKFSPQYMVGLNLLSLGKAYGLETITKLIYQQQLAIS